MLRWMVHVIRMRHSRLPHRVLCGQLRLGHRSVGGKKKRFNNHIKSILKKCVIHLSRLETLASNIATLRSTCAFGMLYFDDEYDRAAALRCSRRHLHAPVLCPIPDSVQQCPLYGRQCFSRIGLLNHNIDIPHFVTFPVSTLKSTSLSSILDGLQRRCPSTKSGMQKCY